MSAKGKAIAVGLIFFIACLFLYFTIRFKYIEQDHIESLIRTTNLIVKEYYLMEKRIAGEKRTSTTADLSGYLKYAHRKYRDIALLAITDSSLSIRLSSKNDRFIKSADLFEAILKDFTQEKFNISKSHPFIIRYYDEKSGGRSDQLKFYIFLNKIGSYRLLAVYPFTFGKKILIRTVLEISLIAVFIVIITAALYILAGRKPDREAGGEGYTIDLNTADREVEREDRTASRDVANVVSDTLSRYIREQFARIHGSFETDSVSLYLFHPPGRLIKTMELKGNTFLRIDSISFDTIDIDNEAGKELRSGATMVLEDGRKIIMPLIYNNSFLGSVNVSRQQGLRGSDINDIKAGMAGILKNIHDFIVFNDVMNDPGTGLNSKIYFHLKYNEYLKLWSSGKDFSILFVQLFDEIGHINNNEKNTIMKLIAPSISEVVKNNGFICRYDDYLAVILNDMNSRKAGNIARDIRSSLKKYRIKINPDSIVRITPAFGVSSTDTARAGDDLVAAAVQQLGTPE
ncbi:MAG: hypothetical protein A2176_01270 [Spirochaetes bacterium RBG_13_51_14]|nr:MAG: hypothetical protein A2176_01270 [Spirochaetes bacterium RBG_13_51_14]